MKPLILALLSVLFSVAITQGQTNTCVFDGVQENLRKSPSFVQQEAQTNALIKSKSDQILKSRALMRNQSGSGVMYNIPVVVHVIYKTGDETPGSPTNPTDTQIQEALTRLNNDFAGNGGGNEGATTPVQFTLAKRSPNCTSTTGINRINGGNIAEYNDKGLAYVTSNYGASEANIRKYCGWPPSQYYNIWIIWRINTGTGPGSANGYAYFPYTNSVSPNDGLFILPQQMTKYSSVLTHEIGHALGLYHSFEGDDYSSAVGGCPANTNPKTQGDMVEDTDPVSRTWYCYADTDPNPCNNNKPFNGIQRNIMGYASCTNLFTNGQSVRMLASLQSARMSQVNSLGAIPPPSTGLKPSNQDPKNITYTNNNNEVGPCNIQLGNINYNSMGYSGDGYSFYNDNTCNYGTTIAATQNHALSVTTQLNRQVCKAWIDFNNNGIFESTELVMNSVTPNGISDYKHSAVISTAKLNANGVLKNISLRMRVMSDQTTSPDFGPDSKLQYGQTEDFWINIETALNVNFGSINAQLKNNALHVNWDTETESDNDHFLIEGSKDGSNFFTIKTVQTKAENGNSTSLIHYNENINNNNGTFASAAGIIVLALLILIAAASNKKKLALVSCIGILFLVACNKNDVQSINAENEIKFIRISQVDKNGVKNYSKTVQIIKE